MLPVFKIFILFWVSAVSSQILSNLINIRDDVPWVKTRQGITSNFMTGMLKGGNTLCTGTRQGRQVQGVCKPLKECLLQRGATAGVCNLLGACCILERSCFNTTNAKLAYFVSPSAFQSQCSLTVNLHNRDVCQVRLDFERFEIAGPGSRFNGLNNESAECIVDTFTVSNGVNSANWGFPVLCGDNTGQHIYIPVNSTQFGNAITLNFQLQADRNQTNTQPMNPEWRIKITQLECAIPAASINNIQSTLFTMYQRFKNKKNNNAQTDSALIAPSGCLQYHTERSGTYESFNYNNGLGPYTGNLNYAICFRRTPDVCGIRHTIQYFDMNSNVYSPTPITGDLCNPSQPADGTISHDYILIPGGVSNNQANTTYCGFINSTVTVTSNAPGPFYVGVRTDAFRPYDILERGFRINYQLLNTGCI